MAGATPNLTTARTRRLVHSIFGGLVGRVAVLGAPFLVMPAMLAYLGDAHFGVWMTAVAVTSMALFADLGVGNGLLTRLSAAFGRDDLRAVRTDTASAYAMLSAVALGLAAVCALAWLAMRGLAPHALARALDADAQAIVAASVAAFLIGIPANIIQRVMYASQRVVLANGWQIAGAALSVAATFAAIALRLSPAMVVLTYALAPQLVLILSSFIHYHRHPGLAPRRTEIEWGSARELVALGSRFLILSVLTSVAMNADNVIIAAQHGQEAVTAFAVPAKIGSLLGLIVMTFYMPLWTANGEALARGDYHWVRTQARRMSLIGGAVIAVAGLILVLASDLIIELWMGRSFEGQRAILAWLAGASTVIAIISPYNMILNALSRLRIQIVVWGAYTLATLVLKIVLLDRFGLWIVPAVSMIAYAVIIAPVMIRAALDATGPRAASSRGN